MGNIFDIYFLDGGHALNYHDSIINFFETLKAATNPLPKAINDWIKYANLVTTLRAVGLIVKSTTGPWMRFIPSLKCILDLNPHLLEAVEELSKWIENPSPHIEGTATPIFPTSCLKDGVFESLTKLQGDALDE